MYSNTVCSTNCKPVYIFSLFLLYIFPLFKSNKNLYINLYTFLYIFIFVYTVYTVYSYIYLSLIEINPSFVFEIQELSISQPDTKKTTRKNTSKDDHLTNLKIDHR